MGLQYLFLSPSEVLERLLSSFKMYVVKRDGRKEPVHFDKITARITKLSYGLNPDFCDPVSHSALGSLSQLGKWVFPVVFYP